MPIPVITSFRALARLDLSHARTARRQGRIIAAAHHLTEALEWRRHANRLRSTATAL